MDNNRKDMKKNKNQIQTDYLTITVTDKKESPIGSLLHRTYMSRIDSIQEGVFDRNSKLKEEQSYSNLVNVISNLIK